MPEMGTQAFFVLSCFHIKSDIDKKEAQQRKTLKKDEILKHEKEKKRICTI